MAGGYHSAIVAPILTYAQHGGANRSITDPTHTITASRKDQNGLIIPTIIGCGGRAAQSRPRAGNEGGIIRNGQRWQDGLTWDMFDADLTCFEKVISKTVKSMPEPYVFDLSLVPEIQSRLRMIRPDYPVGPVIRSINSEGMPYTRSGWSRAWARMRKDAKVPKDIWLMDLRAGGVTEAKNLGADPYALRDAAQHADISTTSRYSRDRSSGANNIVQLRQAKQ